MLKVHPIARLACAIFLLANIFTETSLTSVLLIYLLVFTVVILTNVMFEHFRFVLVITIPLLIALLLIWVGVADPSLIPFPHQNGEIYALFIWTRVVACGGVVQALFLPLIAQPRYLKHFLKASGFSGSVGSLVVTAVVFLPEIERRITIIINACRAQERKINGVAGLLQLPTLLMPLVSSLLDSSSRRAELWSHRGILNYRSHSTDGAESSWPFTIGALILGASAFLLKV